MVAAATKKDPFLTRVCFSLLLVQWCSKFCVKGIKKGEGRGVNDCQVCKREVDRKRGGGGAYQTLVRHLGTMWTGEFKNKDKYETRNVCCTHRSIHFIMVCTN